MSETLDEEKIYRELQKYLDSLPIDYPETATGVEIKILKRLFTPQEAEIALKLKSVPEEPRSLFRPFKKKGWTLEQFTDALSKMAKKGAINWIKGKDGKDYYGIAFFAAGFFDYQVDMLTKEFAEECDQYFDEKFASAMLENGILQVRTIPIEQSITPEHHISNFDEIKSIIENIKTVIYLCPCICRQSMSVQGIGCEHPIETCISIGRNPRIYLEQGREITKEEALDVLRMAQNNGLVISPSNAQKPFMICCCCGCSCVFLKNIKKFENPAQYVNSNFFVEIDEKSCTGCGECIPVCHMDANYLDENGTAGVNLGYCIGCGVCIPRCPNDARHLAKKPEEATPPEDFIHLYQTIAQRKKIIQEKRQTDKNYAKVKKLK